MLLSDKTVVVTGASSGIGAAIAKSAHAEGANVVLHGRREEALKAAVSVLGARATYVMAELSDLDGPSKIIARAIEVFGGVDGLVNNAAVFPRSDIDTDIDAQFDHVFHINTRAPLLLSQKLLADCERRKVKGSIVNVGSINAYCGAPFLLMYAMTKGAMMTMTRNLGDTLHTRGVRVNQLNVGWTDTEGEREIQRQAGAPDDWHLRIGEAAAPSGVLLQPEDVANHAVFWLSEKSAPVSGTVLEVEQFPVIGRNRDSG